MPSALQFLCLTAVLAVTLAEPPPEVGHGKGGLTVATAAGKGVRYAGPIVYTNEKPPVIHFPPPPSQKGGFGNGWKSKGRTHSIKYVPLPHHDLPVLIYQSDINPPIHVVNPPKGSVPPPPPPQTDYGVPQAPPLDSYGPPSSTELKTDSSSYSSVSSGSSYGDVAPAQDTFSKVFGEYGAPSASPVYELPKEAPLDSYGPPPPSSSYGISDIKTEIAPQASYGVPEAPAVLDSYGPPQQQLQVQLQDSYGAPQAPQIQIQDSYGPPAQAPQIQDSYGPQAQAPQIQDSYGPPAQSSYAPPPKSEYGPPGGSISTSYGAPPPANSLVSNSYSSSSFSYGVPAKTVTHYGPPKPIYGPPSAPPRKPAPLPHIIYAGHPPIHIFTSPSLTMEVPKGLQSTIFQHGSPPSESYGPPKTQIIEYGPPSQSSSISSSYGVPASGPPAQISSSYGAPQAPVLDSYGPPSPPAQVSSNYGVPQAPVIDSYGPPKVFGEYGAPSSSSISTSYGAPQSSSISSSYGAPSSSSISSSYGAPSSSSISSSYGAPSSSSISTSYGPPQSSSISSSYGPPHHPPPKASIFSFNIGTPKHGPKSQYGPPKLVSVTTTYGKGPGGHSHGHGGGHGHSIKHISHGPPQIKSRPKYAIAPKAWHKPPIIIYQGIKPPVHVFQKSSGGYSPSISGSSSDGVDLTYATSRSSASAGQLIDTKPGKKIQKMQPALWLRTFGVPSTSGGGGMKTLYVSDLTTAGTQFQTYYVSNPVSLQQVAKAAVSPTPLVELENASTVGNLVASPSSKPVVTVSSAEIVPSPSTSAQPRLDVLPAFIANADGQTLNSVPMSYQSIVVQSAGASPSSGEVTVTKTV